MTELEQRIIEYEKAVEEVRRLNAQAQTKSEEAKAVLKQVQDDIRSGSTTGDRRRDFAIAWYGWGETGRRVVSNLHRVEEELTGKVGEVVLMVCRYLDHFGCSGFGGKLQEVFVEEYHLGILRADKLRLSLTRPEALLPTRCYADFRRGRPNRESRQPIEGDLLIGANFVGIDHLDETFSERQIRDLGIQAMRLRRTNPRKLALHIGNEAVAGLLGSDNGQLIQELMDRLDFSFDRLPLG